MKWETVNSKIQCWLNHTSFLSIQLYISSHVNTVKKELLTLHLDQRRLGLKYKLRPHTCNYFLSDLLLTICPLFSEFKTPSVCGSPIIFGARVWVHCEIQIPNKPAEFQRVAIKTREKLDGKSITTYIIVQYENLYFRQEFISVTFRIQIPVQSHIKISDSIWKIWGLGESKKKSLGLAMLNTKLQVWKWILILLCLLVEY